MNRFNVFLDSNIFINAKYNFDGGSLRSLKKYCDSGIAVLFTNDIILREVKNHINSDVDLWSRQAKNAIKDHSELIQAITRQTYDTIVSTLMSAAENLNSQFDTYINGASLLPNNNLSIITLFDDYFAKRAPFENNEKKKHEFPDAVVIMSIKRFLREVDGAVLYVVTDDEGWHNALQNTDGIFLYKNLKELLTEIARGEEELYIRVAQYMGGCVDTLASSVQNWFYDQDWSSSVDNIEMCIECDEIEDISIAAVKLVPDGIEYIDRDDGYAVALFSGFAKIHLHFPYVDHTNEIYDKEDHVWLNTIYGNGFAEVFVPFTGSATIIISEDGEMDLNSADFDEVNLGAIEILEYRLSPYRDNDDVFFNICPDCGKPMGIHNDGGSGFCVDCAPKH